MSPSDSTLNGKLRCGVVMPISAIGDCSAEHWAEVKEIFREAVESISDYDFDFLLVSDQNDVGIIQKRIVQNLYNCQIIICDVSCKNPNVMFELGMRLAFDKPTVIVKDDVTDYSFDTSMIEHLEYPRDLRFKSIVKFKERLARKVVDTYQASLDDPEHSTFLKNFGSFTVAKLEQKVGTTDQVILDMMMDMAAQISGLNASVRKFSDAREHYPGRVSVNRSYLDRANITADEYKIFQDAIRDFISEYASARGVSPEDLIGSSELYKDISQYLEGYKYPWRGLDLVNHVNAFIRTMS